MPCVLITGVQGFLGSALARHYLQQGWRVVGVDVGSPALTGEPAYPPHGIEFYTLNLPSQEFEAVLRLANPDVLIHCAGRASVGFSMEHPEEDFASHVGITFFVLNLLRRFAQSCLFLYPSSAAVYGQPTSLPIDEEHTLSPLSPYGYHKLLSEKICQEFFQFYGIPCVIARIFSAYGVGLKRQVIWDICQKARDERPVILSGNGYESRDFIYISDIVQAFDRLVEHGDHRAQIYNVAAGIEVTIQELAHTILRVLDTPNEVRFNQVVRPGDPRNWRADITRLQAIGYNPTMTIEQGLKLYCHWYQNLEDRNRHGV